MIQVDLNKVKLLKRSHNQASNTIDSNTVTTKLLSFFFSYSFFLAKWSESSFSFIAEKCHPDLQTGNSFSKDCLEFIQGEKEAALVPITNSHYMTKFNFCILWDFMNSTKTISWLSLCD